MGKNLIKESHYFLLASALIVMNLIDAVFTLGFVELGAATEANPIMEILLSCGPVMFVIGKMGLVSLGVMLLWRLRHMKVALAGLVATTSVYGVLCLYHFSSAKMVFDYYAL